MRVDKLKQLFGVVTAGRILLYLAVAWILLFSFAPAATIQAELKQWHKVTLDFTGPATGETDLPNPFTHYRMDVTFTHSINGKSLKVPGYFAADGDAANTSATSGNVWRVHFAPESPGQWNYAVSFRAGENVATSDDPAAGTSAGFFDGETGAFTIGSTNKNGRDLRGKGRLQYAGKHHLRFGGTGKYFMKAGTDSPENLLAYADFDGDFKTDGEDDEKVKTWEPHVADWQEGDPTWQDGKGKGLIGAINYLASEGLNSVSFLTMNINGDDDNVFPYLTRADRFRMDVSRLAQWEIIFEHGTRKGMYLHFKTQETENERLLDGGNLGNERKLYYRELIARFSHHLALNWNLGEEINDASLSQKQAWAQYFHDHDPYRNHIVIHNGNSHFDLMGTESKVTGMSLQHNEANFSDTFFPVRRYVNRSTDYGKPWVVTSDEPGNASSSLRPDDNPGNSHVDARRDALWANIMAGGAGCEFYFGYNYPNSDLTCQDFRSRNAFWDYCRYALEFFEENSFSFEMMTNHNELVSGNGDNANRCLAKIGNAYLVQLRSGGTHTLDLTAATGTFTVKWFNPRAGGPRMDAPSIEGGGIVSLGAPPDTPTEDWIVLVKSLTGASGTNAPPVVSAGNDKSAFLQGGSVDVTLNGSVTDDGLPDEFSLTRVWSLVSGPAPVTFSSTASVTTVANFTAAGTYSLRLFASDSELEGSDEVVVVINLPDSGSVLSYTPTHDAFTNSDGSNNNGPSLLAGNATRITYLQFELPGLGSAPEEVVLKLTESEGVTHPPTALRLFAGISNDWIEGEITGATAPAKGPEVASFTGVVAAGQPVDFDLTDHLTEGGTFTLILESESVDPIAFASKEHPLASSFPVLTVTAANNASPLYPGYSIATVVNRPAALPTGEILAGASDPDGDPLSLEPIIGDSTAGGQVVVDESGLTYTPSIDYLGVDSFPVTVQDGRGGTATANLAISVVPSDKIGENSPAFSMSELGAGSLQFSGVPHLKYSVERSTDLLEWLPFRSLRADSAGNVLALDENSPAPRSFYRLTSP